MFKWPWKKQPNPTEELVELAKSLRVSIDQIRQEWNNERKTISKAAGMVFDFDERLREADMRWSDAYNDAYARTAESHVKQLEADVAHHQYVQKELLRRWELQVDAIKLTERLLEQLDAAQERQQ